MKKFRIWLAGYCIILAATLLIVHLGNQAITVIAENSPVFRHYTIVIDPGHGGVDGGAVSCTGVPESRFNLEISLRLRDLLHFMGYRTLMIRTEDVSIYTEGNTISAQKMSDLKHRLHIISDAHNPVLISIHQNTFPDGRYSGAQVFYANTSGSRELAGNIQRALVNSLNPGNRRKEKRCSGVYLMEHIPCTGVLIECGFLSNPGEEARLRTGNYQKKLSAVIACSLIKFLSNT